MRYEKPDMKEFTEFVIDGKKYIMLPVEVLNKLLSATNSGNYKSIIKDEICERLREARKSAQLTQRELANILDVSHQLISQAENGNLNIGESFVRKFFDACAKYQHRGFKINTLVQTPKPLNSVGSTASIN